jgi:YOP proteins translocation protein K (YscK)
MNAATRSSPDSQWVMRLVEFNLHVARFAHPSWFPSALSSRVFDSQGKLDKRAEPRLSEWLLRKFGLDHEMDWQMSEWSKRLWLLDRPSLDRLTYELAVALHREVLARVVDRARVQLLQEKLDPEVWRFVVEEVPEGHFRPSSPTVDFERAEAEQLRAALTKDGACTLLALLQPTWRAVCGRARLRFNISLAHSEIPPLEPARREHALELICTQLIAKRFPQWAWLF